MHAMTDLDCEKYRHPETAQARKRDTYSDHGVPKAEVPAFADTLVAWLPYLHSVVEASTRLNGGEVLAIGTRPVGSPPHPGSLTRSYLPVVTELTDSSSRAITCYPAVTPPVTFERGFDKDPLRSYLASLQARRRARPDAGDAGTRPRVRRRHDAESMR